MLCVLVFAFGGVEISQLRQQYGDPVENGLSATTTLIKTMITTMARWVDLNEFFASNDDEEVNDLGEWSG